MKSHNRRVLGGITAFTVMTAALTSCGGGPEYNYTTPSAICDVEIDSAALQGLLPGGEEFHAEPRIPLEGSCEVQVDEVVQVITTAYAYDEYRGPQNYIATNEIESPVETDLIDGGEGMLWDSGAIASWRCHDGSQSEDYKNVVTVIHIPESRMDGEEGRDNATDFARSYFAGLYSVLECNL